MKASTTNNTSTNTTNATEIDFSRALQVCGLSQRVTREDVTKLLKNILSEIRVSMHSIIVKSTAYKVAVVEALGDKTFDELLNRTFRLHGRQVFLRPLRNWDQVQVCEQAKAEPGKLFIRNIPLDMSNQTLQTILADFGELSYCYIVRAKKIPQSHAYYGFANFSEPRISSELAESSPLRVEGTELLFSLFKAPKKSKLTDKKTD